MVEGQARIQAARWVVALGRVRTALFVVGAISATLGAGASWSLGPLVPTLLLTGAAAGWHAVLTAFDRHSRAAWAALVVWSAAGVLGRLGDALVGEDVGVVGLVGGAFDAVVLGLLLHPDSREWVAPSPGSARRGPRTGGSPGAADMPHDHRRRHVQLTEEPS
jgi:hypothetical protein